MTSEIYEQVKTLPANEIEILIAQSQAFLDGLRASTPVAAKKRGRPRKVVSIPTEKGVA